MLVLKNVPNGEADLADYAQIEMPNLLERLAKLGLQPSYVREKVLPSWWDSELENDPTAVVEAAGYIAKRLGLDVASVFSPSEPISFKWRTGARFKRRQDTDEQCLQVAQGLASRVAEMVGYATQQAYQEPLTDASIIRQYILSKGSLVDLDTLLEFCWWVGIPVVHFTTPEGTRKMDGMVGCFDGRPVIVISCNRKSKAWLAFILAHELGHILKGHVQGLVFVDEEISHEEQDIEEIEANEVAAQLLLGDAAHSPWGKLSVGSLIRQVKQISPKKRIDPAILCLNYAWKTKDWVTGNTALKSFEKKSDAPASINAYLAQQISWEKLDRDSQEYLRSVIGA